MGSPGDLLRDSLRSIRNTLMGSSRDLLRDSLRSIRNTLRDPVGSMRTPVSEGEREREREESS